MSGNERPADNEAIDELLTSLESRLISTDKLLELTNYINRLNKSQASLSDSYTACDRNKNEIIQILHEYNEIIHESIQAINTLRSQKDNFCEEKGKDKEKVQDFSLYERYNITDSKNLNYDYVNMANRTCNISDNFNSGKNFYESVRKNLQLAKKDNEKFDANLKIMNITNSILNKLDLVFNNQESQIYFAEKYENKNFKIFIDNIINYKYDYSILTKIESDLINLNTQIKSCTSTKSFENEKYIITKSNIKYSDNQENPNFENILRRYDTNNSNSSERTRFNRFFRQQKYFDKKMFPENISPNKIKSNINNI